MMAVFSLPIVKVSYGLIYVEAESAEKAFEYWCEERDVVPETACEWDDPEYDTSCGVRDIITHSDTRNPVPDAIIPAYHERYMSELHDEYNKLTERIAELNKMLDKEAA